MSFLSHLQSIIPVSARLQEELARIGKKRTIEKGQYLLRSGERCNDIWFVEQGLLRGFYFHEEREITNWMAIDGEFGTSFYSLITRTPSTESIVAIETTQAVQLSHDALQRLYTDFPETERIGRLLTESYYIKLDGRLLGIQFKTAKERYDLLLATNPILVQRAPLGYIASYLGITQETLSRIRAQH